MSSPSVVFTDEQALIGDKGTLYSSTSEEAASSIADEILESSQPESQVTNLPVTTCSPTCLYTPVATCRQT